MPMPFFEALPLMNAGMAVARRAWRSNGDQRQVVYNGKKYVALDEWGREALVQPDWSYEMQFTDWYVEDRRDKRKW